MISHSISGGDKPKLKIATNTSVSITIQIEVPGDQLSKTCEDFSSHSQFELEQEETMCDEDDIPLEIPASGRISLRIPGSRKILRKTPDTRLTYSTITYMKNFALIFDYPVKNMRGNRIEIDRAVKLS